MRSRKFTHQDQLHFSEFSGDYNPFHIDTVIARRLIFGSVAVHGIHSLLWGLDHWLQDKAEGIELRSIEAVFNKPIRVGDTVSYSLKSENEGHVEIELLIGTTVATRFKFEWSRADVCNTNHFSAQLPQRRECRVLLESEAGQASGSLPLCFNHSASAVLFQNITQQLSPLQISQLLATTRLVGMECPGLHSVYASFELTFENEISMPSMLAYEVIKQDSRFGMVLIKVISPKMRGTVTAFFRPPPQKQISFKESHEQISQNEFSNQRALIIGGSRGLGEVTTKLLSAGGAEVVITYCQGAEEANGIVDEITSAGGAASSFSFDVLDNQVNITDRLASGWVPTHLYYFATPFIAQGSKGEFSGSLFRKFCEYYVAGFQRTVEQLSALGLKAVFFPSSVYVKELPSNMGEYAAAKMAGEVLCAFLDKTQHNATVYAPRLPKMATDQTASFIAVDNQAPTSIMLEHLRRLRDASSNSREATQRTSILGKQ